MDHFTDTGLRAPTLDPVSAADRELLAFQQIMRK
jgi:hypothetical protein